ncbi:MAG: cytochrome c oxidase accessory protein CcoG [Flammeovirgaceae bacterium]|nr:MAG: cytochrome c oxidase accessory protein CcoG [Flammeovirgaceae bacterium]
MTTDSENFYQYDEEFRNSIATVDEKGKRVWIYPKKPAGQLHNYRIAVTVTLLSIFFAGPFIKIGGQPLLMLNLFERRFVIFGQVFWPQDFFLLALTLITLFVFIILFTVVFGRVWCGWACPQTLFMEMVFRKIEYWIEGDANQQRKLNQEPWTPRKIFKKAGKQVVFILISVIISHTAMAYLIGIEQVKEIVSQPPTEHLAGFIGLVAFTGVFYFVFAWFREQACIAVCPYGRLQGVLLVKDSIVVAYDWLRGEPRGKIKKGETQANRGDCIDCKLCVHVCPTGIDIRNGTQLECVNCTACIDACDEVMVKIGKPKGLIRFASYNSIKDGVKKLFTPRVAGYSVVLTALVGLLSFMIATRSDIETTILKVPGTLFQRTDDGKITNLYNIEFVNKTFDAIELTLKAESPPGVTIRKVGDQEIVVTPGGLYKGVCFIEIPAELVSSAKMVVKVGVYKGGEQIEIVKAKFVGPVHSHRDRVKGGR